VIWLAFQGPFAWRCTPARTLGVYGRLSERDHRGGVVIGAAGLCECAAHTQTVLFGTR